MISYTSVEHIDEVKTICDVQLGQDYISRKRIITAQISLVVLVEENESLKVAAWASSDIINEKLAVLSQCVVHPEREGRGFATWLVEKRLNILSQRGIKNCVAYCWKHPDGRIPMEGILTKFGFKSVKTMKHAFVGTNCKFCGNDCRCDCVVFLKRGF
jgi:N-acetylglutamate synthase-like GNAT family acetyltransferase